MAGGVMHGTSPLGKYAFSYLANGWTNYSVEAKVQFPAGAFGGGVGGRVNPTLGEHYAAWIYPENSAGGSNVLNLVKFTSWTNFSVLATTNLANVGTTNHTVKLTFNTNYINVYFDDLATTKISVADTNSPYLNGGVSLDMWTYTNSYIISIDDVIVIP